MAPPAQTTTAPASEQLPRQGFFLLASLALFWGTNWPAMKLAVLDMAPWTFRAICFIAGAGGLMLVARARGLSLRIPRDDLGPLILTALINVTCWQIFSAFGLTLMAAGRASIIAFTMPLWASILSVVFLRERMTVLRIVGLALGLAALAILLTPEFGRMGGAPWGAAMMLAAAISWAAGTVMLKTVPWRMDTIQLAAWQLVHISAKAPRRFGFFHNSDTAGESFELNTSAAQRVGMLTGTVRAIILAQGSVPGK